MRDFNELRVWQKAHRLTVGLYQATKQFPDTERYGLTSQMQRAAVSIPSNIAEGCGRGGDKELVRFLRIASGSASELEYQILLARELDYIDDPTHQRLWQQVIEVKKMLYAFIEALNH